MCFSTLQCNTETVSSCGILYLSANFQLLDYLIWNCAEDRRYDVTLTRCYYTMLCIQLHVYMHGGYDDMDDEWLTPKWRWDQYGGGGGDDVWSKHPSATNSRTLVSPNPRLLHFCTNWHTTIHMGCHWTKMQTLLHTSHFYTEGLPQVVQCKKTPRLNFHETKVPAPRFSKTCSGRHWVPMKAAHILCIVDLGAVGVSASRSLIWWVDTIC